MKITLFLLMSLSIPACAAPISCDQKETQSELTRCSIQKFNSLNDELLKINSDLKYSLVRNSLFLESDEAWESFRDLHCESVTSIYEGGSLYQFALYECKNTLTEHRIEQLKSDYEETLSILEKGSP